MHFRTFPVNSFGLTRAECFVTLRARGPLRASYWLLVSHSSRGVYVRRSVLLIAFVTLLTAFVHGQQPTLAARGTGVQPVTDNTQINQSDVPVNQSDLYCAGFVSPKSLPRQSFVAGGVGTPIQTHFRERDLIYLHGSGYEPGMRVSLVREMRDLNAFSPFPETRNLLLRTGQMYSELGYARILEIRGHHVAVAQVEFACEGVVTGDLAVPFVPKAEVSYRKQSNMDRFPATRASVTGRIVAAREFDQYLSAGSKIYVNVGARNGVKAGDYFRVVRDYRIESNDAVDAAVYNEPFGEETQKNPPQLPIKSLGDLPKRVVGEAIVLGTTSGTATAMITFSLEDVHVGDVIELESE